MPGAAELGLILAIVAAIGGFIWRAFAGAKKAGVDQERAAQLGQQQEKVNDANQARRGVAGGDVERLLTPPRDRH